MVAAKAMPPRPPGPPASAAAKRPCRCSCAVIPSSGVSARAPPRSLTEAARRRSMASQPRRDPVSDPPLTPENAALVVIDCQPLRVSTAGSMDSRELVADAVSLAQPAKLFGSPMVLSTVGVRVGLNPGTVPRLKEARSAILSPAAVRTTVFGGPFVGSPASIGPPRGFCYLGGGNRCALQALVV